MSETAHTAAAASAAVDGPTEKVTVSRPSGAATLSLFIGMALTSVLALILVGALVLYPWPETPLAVERRINFIGWSLVLTILANTGFALAITGFRLGRVTAQAVAGSVTVEGG